VEPPYFPTPHAVHSAARLAEYMPKAQFTQAAGLDAPAIGDDVPAGQLTQVVDAVAAKVAE
jgi:uncharacterized protein YbaA (DUF1428 family)